MKAVPPPPAAPVSSGTALPSPRAQIVAEPSPAVARLALGSSVQGHVLPDAPRGMVHIQTDAGMLVGKSTLPLPAGSDVTLLLQARTPRPHFQITAMNAPPTHSPPTHSAPTHSAPPQTAPGEAVTVTLRSPGGPAATAPGLGSAPPPPATGSPADAVVVRPAAGVATSLPAGTRIAVRVLDVHPPMAGSGGGAAPAPAVGGSPAPAPGQILTGTVMASTSGGPPLLATPIGALALDAIAGLPRGGALSLQIVGSPVVPSPTLATAPGAPPAVTGTPSLAAPNPTAAGWPALEAAMQAVQESNPAAAQHVVDTVLPGVNAGLTSRTLLFLRALGRGTVQEWLGESAAEALKHANPALLRQLGDEFRHMGRGGPEVAPDDDWRVVHLPLVSGAAIEPVRLLTRRRGGERDEPGGTDTNTRFVIEVTLSQLGRIQFDGLVREDGKRLDLMVRSEPPLPTPVHRDIRALFTRSSEIAGLTGEVGFQAAPAAFIDVKAEPSVPPPNAMMV